MVYLRNFIVPKVVGEYLYFIIMIEYQEVVGYSFNSKNFQVEAEYYFNFTSLKEEVGYYYLFQGVVVDCQEGVEVA